MLKTTAEYLKRIALNVSDASYFSDQLKKKYSITISASYDPFILRQIFNALSDLPTELVKDCGFNLIEVKYLGPNKMYYPNHGCYIDHSITINSDCYYHPDRPDDFMAKEGFFLYRPRQTLFHEMGHAFDHNKGEEGKPLSLQEEWLKLSGWSPNCKPGLKRLIIREKGAPEVIGEWFFNPKAGFTRFYAKRNPWDDFADSFCFYVGRLGKKLPPNKQKYFRNLLGKYYK